ncbi:helicase-exonuclease AddAB subunit AddA [Clostridium ganghwense]|uniref:ATP-dependent helicase/nuclease subunit A n=1 Tax=Clostridium ganghwense TaxID=312089 RepID=A0ABT4CQQ7_9CLOT|nr:helicase-exonuclease AddAB subunit AddA [Clostridium ganghwense]MCY6371393.1 helicase-exonuclease AddAB subunit AddA [Clostridium ganghwense]
MGDVKWTTDQQAAIDTHGCNLLVAAAAGSGKTAVLVERIIKMITHPTKAIDIDKLLVVTFTNAAASEMKERIAKAISEELKKHPKSRQLQRQLTLLNKASITTMHSFCLEVIRNNFHHLDIDPSFRIGDETETILLKGETLEQMFEEAYEDDNCSIEFLKLMECYSNNKDDLVLQNIVLDLYRFAMSSPYPRELLNQMAEDFNVDKNYKFTESKWAKILMEDIRIELEGLYKAMNNALDIIRKTEGLDPYEETFLDDVRMIQDLLAACEKSWDNLFDEFEKVSFKRLKACKNCEDKDTQEKVKGIRNKAKKSINDDLKNKVVIYGSHETTLDLIELYPVMRKLSDLVIEFIDRYAQAKRERGIIDFNDFEHFCLQVLTEKNEDDHRIPSKTAFKLRDKYDEILVDEYQDSNEVQEAIVNAIAKKDEDNGKNNNVFMVGDVKQSIYRFRQAKPEIFLQKYNSYPLEEGETQRKITLFKNFRSRKEILDAVNFIFKQIMSVNVGELEYDEKEALNLGADYAECIDETVVVGGNIELHLLEKNKPTVEEGLNVEAEQEEIPSNIQMEARIVVKRINELVNPKDGEEFKIFDKNTKEYRKVEYKDIVILLRSTAKWAPVFMEELKENYIPSYADTGSGYFETLEIKTMLSLLQIIDNPRQDIPLIAVLRSPIASFTPEELIDIRLKDKEAEFYDALKMASEEDNSNIQKKCSSFLEKIKIWRDKSIHMPIDEFIWYLYTDTGYYGYVGAMAGGVQRQANLRILFQRARQYEQTSYKGLFNFINFINKLKVSSGDMGSAKILGENENVVRIMSIHKSKGLEFPVVILSALGKGFNMQDLNQKILFHGELGYGPDFVDINKRVTYQTVLKQALKKKIKMESLSEEMRILYVALTRAKEKLIMTGAVNSIEKCVQKWSYSVDNDEEKLPEYEMLKAKNYLDWICPVIMRHKDGEKLRETAGIEDYKLSNLVQDDSKWEINLYSRNEVIINEEEGNEELEGEELEKITEHSKYYEEIKRRLQWKYDYIEASKLPTLLTVTELKRMKDAELYEDYSQRRYTPKLVKKPAFLEKDKKLTGAEKGTAMHAVMQKIDYKKELTIQEIKVQIAEMVRKELITDEQGDSVDVVKILNFFNSNIGKRMLRAKKVYREIPFHMQLKVTDVYENLDEEKYNNEHIIIQGIIDCYFEEDDEVVLLDYKTDYIKDGDVEGIKEKYKEQLGYYKKAIEEITGKKVKEKYLYLFYNDSEAKI